LSNGQGKPAGLRDKSPLFLFPDHVASFIYVARLAIRLHLGKSIPELVRHLTHFNRFIHQNPPEFKKFTLRDTGEIFAGMPSSPSPYSNA
jgi:hypothetical protein